MTLSPDFTLVTGAVIDTKMFKVYIMGAGEGVVYEWPSLRRVHKLALKLTNTNDVKYPLCLSHGVIYDGIMTVGNSMGPTTYCSTARFSEKEITNGLVVMTTEFYVGLSRATPDGHPYDKWFLYEGVNKTTSLMFQGSNPGSVSDRYYAHQYEGWYKDVWSPRPDTIERLLTTEGMIWYKIREYEYMK